MTDLTLRIQRARRKAALSQTQLAAGLRVNRSAVAQWERRGGTRPTAENLARLAVALGVNFEWLATGRGKMQLAGGDGEEQVVLLDQFARDVVEERLLLGVRTLDQWQVKAVLDLVEALGKGRSVANARRRGTGGHGSLEE